MAIVFEDFGMDNHQLKRTSLPVYLDKFERERLEKIAEEWGTSLSATIKRLIREKPIYPERNQ
ncbi:MAG: hypothetical protein ACYTXE_40625 [Nostoc sp.]